MITIYLLALGFIGIQTMKKANLKEIFYHNKVNFSLEAMTIR